ncbi:aromatic ring-hydroxylating dioxygenase subunit alpha [Halioglobus maricola]|uniref:Aromatic ring-hydroxylating dioxygenase subunit alpha n=1 Tax=Halioglobus maricola TaxID=2601894 RepID=A0A5P9NHV3_9GAMM|nr:aromatic ring-hydroxylating dioxygenase subunit alpha [Halioglobus maricola]QFU75119.1 aromatic ring-hydroxylating dioxygenase subunit alpha [Halioglobus maricola]
MSEETLGSARASGPTVAETIAADAVPPPQPLLEQRYEFLGDADIDCSRYTSSEFARLEDERLWARCWQWACREEHIPDVGDNYVHNIGPWSVIVVRSAPDTVQAFVNACTHRGTRILDGEGAGYSNQFTCPFHGWGWSLDGELAQLPGRWDFPHAGDKSHSLRPVACELWGGFVFINLDSNAKPLEDYMDVLPEHFQHFPLERRRIRAHVQKVLPANWKAAQEAFLEAYHNFETHDAPNGANTQYDVFGKYVTRFIHNIGCYSSESLDDYPGDKWRSPPLTENEMLQILSVFGLEHEEVPEGETARSVAAADLRKRLGEAWGVDLTAVSDALMLDSIEYHLFPNMFFFPGITVPMVYRFRPNGDDVNTSLFDIMILEPLADGAEHPEPPEPVKLDVEQSYTEAEVLSWLAPVYDEDTGNLHLQQQGLRGSKKRGITLGNYQEARIRRVHMTLDEFLQEGEL